MDPTGDRGGHGLRAVGRRIRRGPRQTEGFTLIELVVTMTIIGLVVAVALPSMMRLDWGDDAGSLEPARTLLLEAKRASEVSGETVEVTIVPRSGRYRVEQRSPSGEPSVREGVLPLSNTRTARSDDRFHVVFRSVGMGVGDTLHAADRWLAVEAETGRIRVSR